MAKRWAIETGAPDDKALFEAVEKLLSAGNPKVEKGTVVEIIYENAKKEKITEKFTLKNSFIGIPVMGPDGKEAKGLDGKAKYKAYAIANKKYNRDDAKLGEGAYGKVKLAQDIDGHNFAVKIEARGKRGEDDAELRIMKAIGYTKGEEVHQLEQEKEFKGKQTKQKLYTMMELREGKELFNELYTNALTPGQLYVPGSPERKDELSSAQKLIIAIRCCQAIQDLHYRGVVHGDVKPANFMANIQGDHIVLGAIDFGFSFQLKEGEKSIKHKGIPQGTHKDYMPPEVTENDARGEEAIFSPASDVYSLGKMLQEDFGLPKEFCEAMLKSNPDERLPLPEVIRRLGTELEKELERTPEAERSPDAVQCAFEASSGIKQMKEGAGPKSKDDFISQLMSGFHDPIDSVGTNKFISYTMQDYKTLAQSIYARIPPNDYKATVWGDAGPVKNPDGSVKTEIKDGFFTQLGKAYYKLTDEEDKLVFLHNTELFIKEIIKANPEMKFVDSTEKGIAAFVGSIKEKEKDNKKINDVLGKMQENLDVEIKNRRAINESRKEKNLASSKENAALMVVTVGPKKIEEALAKPKKNRLSRAKTAIGKATIGQVSKKSQSHTDEAEIAKALAHDFKQIQLDVIRQIDISDFHKVAWTKNSNLSSKKFTDMVNNTANSTRDRILGASSLSEQRRIYRIYLQTALECIKNNDYMSAVAIYSGVAASPIERLSYLNDDPIAKEMRKELDEICNPQGNYKNIAKQIEIANAEGKTAIPFIGQMQTFLVGIDENPNEIRGKMNEGKLLMEGRLLKNFADLQEYAFHQKTEAHQTNLLQDLARPMLSEDDAYNMSVSILSRADRAAYDKGDKKPLLRFLQPINLQEITSLDALKTKFPNGAISKQLSVEEDGKIYYGKKAYKKLLEKATPYLEQSKEGILNKQFAINFLTSFLERASENGLLKRKVDGNVEKLSKFEANIKKLSESVELSSKDLLKINILNYLNTSADTYTQLSAVQQEQLKNMLKNIEQDIYADPQGLTIIKGEKDETLLAEARKVKKIVADLDKIVEIEQEYQNLKRDFEKLKQFSAEIVGTSGLFSYLNDAVSLKAKLESLKNDSNPLVKEYAHATSLVNEKSGINNLIEEMKKSSVDRIETTVDVYMNLIEEKNQLSVNKDQNEERLKEIEQDLVNLEKGLQVFMKEGVSSEIKEKAKQAYDVIDKVKKIPTLIESFKNAKPEAKEDIARKLSHFLRDKDSIVVNKAESSYDSELKEFIENINISDLKFLKEGAVQDLQIQINRYLQSVKGLSDSDKEQRKQIELKISGLNAKIDVLAQSPITEIRDEAAKVKEQMKKMNEGYQALKSQADKIAQQQVQSKPTDERLPDAASPLQRLRRFGGKIQSRFKKSEQKEEPKAPVAKEDEGSLRILIRNLEKMANPNQTLRVAEYVAKNTPAWVIVEEKPRRGAGATPITVQRIVGNMVLESEKMDLTRGESYAYKSTDIQGLTPVTATPVLYGTMAPDQYYFPEPVKLPTETIDELVKMGIELRTEALVNKEISDGTCEEKNKQIRLEELRNNFDEEAKRNIKDQLAALTVQDLGNEIGKIGDIIGGKIVPNTAGFYQRISTPLQEFFGKEHIGLIANKIGTGDPRQYAVLSIIGERRSEAKGFGLSDPHKFVVSGSESKYNVKNKNVNHENVDAPAIALYKGHNPQIHSQLLMQSGAALEGVGSTNGKLAIAGSDMDQVIHFYEDTMKKGIPVAVNCTDGIDRTGMTMVGLLMLHQYHQGKDISKLPEAEQKKELINLMEGLRRDRGPYFLRGTKDIAIAVTFGLALIATQKQMDIQREMLKKADALSPALLGLLQNQVPKTHNTFEPDELEVKLKEYIDTLPENDEERKLAEGWLSCVSERAQANRDFVFLNFDTKFDNLLTGFPRHSDDDQHKDRMLLSYGDLAEFNQLIQKGFDPNAILKDNKSLYHFAVEAFLSNPVRTNLLEMKKMLDRGGQSAQNATKEQLRKMGFDERIIELSIKAQHSGSLVELSNLGTNERDALNSHLQLVLNVIEKDAKKAEETAKKAEEEAKQTGDEKKNEKAVKLREAATKKKEEAKLDKAVYEKIIKALPSKAQAHDNDKSKETQPTSAHRAVAQETPVTIAENKPIIPPITTTVVSPVAEASTVLKQAPDAVASSDPVHESEQSVENVSPTIAEASSTPLISLNEYLKEPSIPEMVGNLAVEGGSNAKSLTKEGARAGGRGHGWVRQTFGRNEDTLLASLKNIDGPQTYTMGEIKKSAEKVAEAVVAEEIKPTITVVQGVSASDLHRRALGDNSVFQVASQFDFQESIGAFDTPVSDYPFDPTQGPYAAIEAAAGALHRKAAKKAGKLPHALTDMIPDDLSKKYPGLYKDGYLELSAITEEADKKHLLDHIEANIDKLKILPQWVTCEVTQAQQLQVFCAAPSFQHMKNPPDVESVDHQICEALVVAQYRATAQLAVIRSRETGLTVPLHLTMVGQSAFNNNPAVMKKAMEAVAEEVKGEKVAVYVHAFTNGDKNKLMPQMTGNFKVAEMSAEEFKRTPHPDVDLKFNQVCQGLGFISTIRGESIRDEIHNYDFAGGTGWKEGYEPKYPELSTDEKAANNRQGVKAYIELVNTEADYVNDLAKISEPENKEAILALYDELEPEKLKGFTSKEEMSQFLDIIAKLKEGHEEVLKALKEPNPEKWAQSLLKLQALYVDYTVNFEKIKVPPSIDLKFRGPEGKGLSLSDYIIKPVQRMTKYPLLIREIEKTVSEESPFYAGFMKAKEGFLAIPNAVNYTKTINEESSKFNAAVLPYQQQPTKKSFVKFIETLPVLQGLKPAEMQALFEKVDFSHAGMKGKQKFEEYVFQLMPQKDLDKATPEELVLNRMLMNKVSNDKVIDRFEKLKGKSSVSEEDKKIIDNILQEMRKQVKNGEAINYSAAINSLIKNNENDAEKYINFSKKHEDAIIKIKVMQEEYKPHKVDMKAANKDLAYLRGAVYSEIVNNLTNYNSNINLGESLRGLIQARDKVKQLSVSDSPHVRIEAKKTLHDIDALLMETLKVEKPLSQSQVSQIERVFENAEGFAREYYKTFNNWLTAVKNGNTPEANEQELRLRRLEGLSSQVRDYIEFVDTLTELQLPQIADLKSKADGMRLAMQENEKQARSMVKVRERIASMDEERKKGKAESILEKIKDVPDPAKGFMIANKETSSLLRTAKKKINKVKKAFTGVSKKKKSSVGVVAPTTTAAITTRPPEPVAEMPSVPVTEIPRVSAEKTVDPKLPANDPHAKELAQAIKETKTIPDLIQLLEKWEHDIISNDGKSIDKKIMLESLRKFSSAENIELFAKISTSHLIYNGSHITRSYGLREKFSSLAKEQHENSVALEAKKPIPTTEQSIPVPEDATLVSEHSTQAPEKPPVLAERRNADKRKAMMVMGPQKIDPPPHAVIFQGKGSISQLNNYLTNAENASKHNIKPNSIREVDIKTNGFTESKAKALEMTFEASEATKEFKAYAHDDDKKQGVVFSLEHGMEKDPEKFRAAVEEVCYLAVVNAGKGAEFDLSVVKDEKVRAIVEEAFDKAIQKAVDEKHLSANEAEHPKVKSARL